MVANALPLAAYLRLATFIAATATDAVLPRSSLDDTNSTSSTDVAMDPEADAFLADTPLSILLGPILSLVDTASSVPDAVLLAGDQATDAWLQSAGAPLSVSVSYTRGDSVNSIDSVDSVNSVNSVDASADTTAIDSFVGVARCVAAVAAAIASDLLPAAKLLKIKKLIKALGGIKRVAKLFIEYREDRREAIRQGGHELLKLVEILLGIDSIKKHCR